MLKLKRAYDQPEPQDGTRVLVDRLWPRGVKKEDAAIAWWPRELAPTADLRRWFAHDPAKFEVFAERYRAELAGKDELNMLLELAREGTVTLVYAAKDETHNHAVVLRGVVLTAMGGSPAPRG